MVTAVSQQLPQRDVPGVMWRVNAALLPGLFIASYFYGMGYVSNIVLALAVALPLEAVALHLQSRPVRDGLSDGSAVLTCALLGLACPPDTSFAIIACASAIAIGVAKHVFGGLGHNLFNPAMVGYACALVSFPAAFAAWPVPTDGVTAATALDSLKTLTGQTMADRMTAANGFGQYGGYAAEWLGLAFAVSGAWLCWQRLAAWRVVLGFVCGLGLFAALGNDSGSSVSGGSPALHLLSGGTLLAAAFVLTDPVTHPTHAPAQWAFALLVAAIVYVIRRWGAYPDGIAFAVLLGNGAAPLLDRLLAPRRREMPPPDEQRKS